MGSQVTGGLGILKNPPKKIKIKQTPLLDGPMILKVASKYSLSKFPKGVQFVKKTTFQEASPIELLACIGDEISTPIQRYFEHL